MRGRCKCVPLFPLTQYPSQLACEYIRHVHDVLVAVDGALTMSMHGRGSSGDDAREYLPAQDLAAEHHLRTIRGDEIHIVQDGIEEREKRVEAPAAFDAKFTPVPARDAWRTKTVAVPLISRLPHGKRGSATHLARIGASAAPHAGCTGHRPLNCCAIVTNSSTAGDVTGGSAIPNSK